MKGGHNNTVWRKIQRDRAHARQGGKCKYCTVPIPRSQATYDHVWPRSRWGADTDKNCAAACFPCNVAKGSKKPSEFRKQINRRGYSGDHDIDLIRVCRRLDRATKDACKRIRGIVR